MIYLTGDLHGDLSRFKEIERSGIKKGDTLIVCGDFGFLWEGGRSEQKALQWIGKRKYQVLFVDGCHENHRLLNEYPETEFAQGRARRISGGLTMLLRGEIYELEGNRVFAMGGGDSIEQFEQGKEEAEFLPSEEEIARARQNLEQAGNRVDLIVTHDAPGKIREFIDIESREEWTRLHTFFDELSRTVQFRGWYLGKYHLNKRVPPYYYLLFTQVVRFESD